jgi:hypothetical protein
LFDALVLVAAAGVALAAGAGVVFAAFGVEG